MKQLFFSFLLVALLLNLGLGFLLGMDRAMESDSYYFQQLAVSLASGEGYVFKEGFWPESPSMQRLPGWPFLLSVVFKLIPGVAPAVLMRITALSVNALNAVLIGLLTWRLFRSLLPSLIAFLLYVVHPTAMVCAYDGLSEPLFITLCVAGILCTQAGALDDYRRPLLAFTGFLLLGLSVLVRANFLLWIGFLFLGLVVRGMRDRRLPGARELAVLAAGAIIFLLPPMLWAARNHRVCGDFPFLSTLRGQTFYGGNNEIVAGQKKFWGYWVFPDQIPGETTMWNLSRTMSAYEVDVYYTNKGKTFVRDNLLGMPKLELGKLVRAYVPLPWNPSLRSCALAAFRWALYIGLVLGLACAWGRLDRVGRMSLVAVGLTNVATVLIFYGYTRFAFVIEPFYLPFVGVAVSELLLRKQMKSGSSGTGVRLS